MLVNQLQSFPLATIQQYLLLHILNYINQLHGYDLSQGEQVVLLYSQINDRSADSLHR